MKNLTRNPIKKLLAVVTFVGVASTGAIAAPRTLANGAPAPGNTVAKGPRYKPDRSAERAVDRARQNLVASLAEEKDAKQQLVSNPRTLLNGAPACGNTGGKAPECTAEMASEAYQWRIDRVKTAEKHVQTARARLHEATQKLALQKLGGGSYATSDDDDDDDYS